MARRDIQFIQGEYYHVYNRGRNRENIFRVEENYFYLLRLLKDAIQGFRITVLAYCLMPNHYHFLFRQDSDNPISDLIQHVFNRYSKAFNKRYGRSGTLFEERFKARRVDKEEYLVHLCRYIHRNPLEAGLVEAIEDWKFSDYSDWIGKRSDGPTDMAFVRARFPTSQEYAQFVLEYESPKNLARNLRNYTID